MAFDRMCHAWNQVAGIVEARHQQTWNVGGLVAAGRAAGLPGQKGAAQAAGQVENGFVIDGAQGSAELAYFAPDGGAGEFLSPAWQGDRENPVDAGVQPEKIGKSFVNAPVNGQFREFPAQITCHWQALQQFGKRRGLDDEHTHRRIISDLAGQVVAPGRGQRLPFAG